MKINNIIDSLKDDMIKSTQELVKIKSVEGEPKEGKPYGEGPYKALDKALNICKDLGFKTKNLDGYIGYAEYGEGEDYVAVLGHLDVVPTGDGWKYDPYAGEIHDGKIHGRGTMDDKGPTLAALYGLKAIKEAKIPLSKRVRIIFGTNEETGSNELPHYLEKEKPPIYGFTPDAEYPIIFAEKGILQCNLVKKLEVKGKRDTTIEYIKGGDRPNIVCDYCEAGIKTFDYDVIERSVKFFRDKTGYDLSLEEKNGLIIVKSKGKAAHGSTPELGENAITHLFKFLGELPVGYSDILSFIRFFNKNIGEETNGESFGLKLSDKESGDLSFNVGSISMDKDKVSMAIDIRFPVTYTLDYVRGLLNKKIEDVGIGIENPSTENPLYFNKDHKLIKSLQKVYREQTGKKAELLAIGGGTYAKGMPNTVAFGPIFPGEPDLIHKPNEYIKIDELVLNSKIYAHAICELAK